jgi:hypothetical protein
LFTTNWIGEVAVTFGVTETQRESWSSSYGSLCHACDVLRLRSRELYAVHCYTGLNMGSGRDTSRESTRHLLQHRNSKQHRRQGRLRQLLWIPLTMETF